jgi:hypothetical protein
LPGDAWIVKKILHASYAKNASKKVTTLVIEFSSKEMLADAAIVEILKLGMKNIFVQTIKGNKLLTLSKF